MSGRQKQITLDPRLKTLPQIHTDLMTASLVAAMAVVPDLLREQILSALKQVDDAIRGKNSAEGRAAGEDALRAWSAYRLQTGLPR